MSAQGEDYYSLLLDNARNLPDNDIGTGTQALQKLFQDIYKLLSMFLPLAKSKLSQFSCLGPKERS